MVFSMKKKLIILIIFLTLFLSISSANAWFFGSSGLSCQQYTINVPDGFSTTEAWEGSDNEKDIYLGTGIPSKGETARYLRMYEVPSFDKIYEKGNVLIPSDKTIVENYTEDNLLVQKCYSGPTNFTYAEFSKDGHNYVLYIEWKGDLNNLNLTDDVNMIKGIMDSTKHK